MAELIRAAHAVTLAGPLIEDAALIHDRERILAVGSYRDLSAGFDGPVRDLGEAVLAPAPVNAHTHLELTHLRGRTLRGAGFMDWVEHLLALPLADIDLAAIGQEVKGMARSGVGAVADIATRNAADVAGLLRGSGLFFVSFCETIGEREPDGGFAPHAAGGLGRASLAGHSLYTTSDAVLRAAKAWSLGRGLPFSLHLAEHEEEEAILMGRPSPFLELLQARGRLPGYEAPGKSPVAQAAALGLLDSRTLAVHCARVDGADMALLAKSRATVCLCPRSNAFISGARGPWEALRRAGIPLCLGTDSLASNDDLDLWNEARYFLDRFSEPLGLVGLMEILAGNAAGVLGLGGQLGSLQAGKAARFAVVPGDIVDRVAPELGA